jgi:hypothetical protein
VKGLLCPQVESQCREDKKDKLEKSQGQNTMWKRLLAKKTI